MHGHSNDGHGQPAGMAADGSTGSVTGGSVRFDAGADRRPTHEAQAPGARPD
jgi:hypothetical protein